MLAFCQVNVLNEYDNVDAFRPSLKHGVSLLFIGQLFVPPFRLGISLALALLVFFKLEFLKPKGSTLFSDAAFLLEEEPAKPSASRSRTLMRV